MQIWGSKCVLYPNDAIRNNFFQLNSALFLDGTRESLKMFLKIWKFQASTFPVKLWIGTDFFFFSPALLRQRVCDVREEKTISVCRPSTVRTAGGGAKKAKKKKRAATK